MKAAKCNICRGIIINYLLFKVKQFATRKINFSDFNLRGRTGESFHFRSIKQTTGRFDLEIQDTSQKMPVTLSKLFLCSSSFPPPPPRHSTSIKSVPLKVVDSNDKLVLSLSVVRSVLTLSWKIHFFLSELLDNFFNRPLPPPERFSKNNLKTRFPWKIFRV